ncbi:hypothetical protein XI01_03485 [Bradyrhizobium sp. CCBAU 21360]|nr:hypothetical protein [Bradyrhizobium sp. CCBAU 21360]
MQSDYAWRCPLRQGRPFSEHEKANDIISDDDGERVLQVGPRALSKVREHRIEGARKLFLLWLKL